MTPLSHHEILGLVGPFSRAGRPPDLARSDRLQRRLVFRPVQHGGEAALEESLQLDLADTPRLTRTLTAPDGLQATLVAESEDLAALLAQIEAVPPARQLRREDGCAVALQQRVGADGGLRLRAAEARLPGLTLTLRLTGVAGFPAEIEMIPAEGRPFAPPSDLLAVLGRAWSRITPVGRSWQGTVALRGSDLARSRAAEAALEQVLAHLQRTLAEPPPQFHHRHRAARWGVALREMGPMAIGLAVVALALELQRQGPERNGLLALLANVAPPLLMGLYFVRREMPYIGLPRVPRPPRQGAWR